MNINELIDSLWEKSSHGTDRETVVMIFNAALEEAANVCDEEAMDERDDHSMRRLEACAREIRALKNNHRLYSTSAST